jgi:hypothetical protein
MFRYLAGAVIGLLLPLLSSAQCLTTLTPNPVFVPPAPYPSSAPEGQFWYGSDALWTLLGVDSSWHMRDNVLNGKGYRTKLVFGDGGLIGVRRPNRNLSSPLNASMVTHRQLP